MFIHTLLLLALAVTAWAQDVTTKWAATAVVTSTVLETVTILGNAAQSLAAPTLPPPPPPPAITPEPPTTLATSFTNRCDDAFCSLGSKVCFYWGGMTSYDVTLGPMPGETHTVLGPCTNMTTTVAETVLTVTHLGSAGTWLTDTSTVPAYTTVVEQW